MTTLDSGGNGTDQRDQRQNKDAQWNPAEWFFEAFFLLLFSIWDFEFTWPENHFRALLYLAAAGGAVVWFAAWKLGYEKWGRRLAILFLVSVGIADTIIGPVVHPDIEVSGTLTPGNGHTPVNSCNAPKDAFFVFIGPIAVWLASNQTRFTLGPRGQNPSLTAERTPKGLMFTGSVYSADGTKMVAVIDKGKYEAINGDYSHASNENDLSTLAVSDEQGHELLHLQYINAHALQIRGVLPGVPWPVKITRNGIEWGGARISSGKPGESCIHPFGLIVLAGITFWAQ